MATNERLVSAAALVAKNHAHVPNESQAYRKARNALLVEEIELRRQLERVAQQRRGLPPGGEVTGQYEFVGETGKVTLADLFADKQTLIIYSYMLGPQRAAPCPMCTSLMASWDHKVPDIEQRVALVAVARSPIERLISVKRDRGWTKLRVYSDTEGRYTRDYVSADDADMPGYNVFARKTNTIRHFYAGEISGEMQDPGQDPRGAPDLDPLWNLLDTTPEGRGAEWYPKLAYDR